MAYLKIMSGDRKGTKITIDREEVVIGRAPENLVHLDDPSVSSRHCVIRRDGRRFTLTDLKSTNGTRLNNVGIDSYRLSAKDIISAGSVDMLFDGDDIEDAKPTEIPPTIIQPAPDAFSDAEHTARIDTKPGFEKRRSSKGFWVGISIVTALCAVAALLWFLRSVFSG